MGRCRRSRCRQGRQGDRENVKEEQTGGHRLSNAEFENSGRRAIVGDVGEAKLCVRQQLHRRPAMSQNQPPAAAWTEPPWSGWIETTGDALLILEAARRGLIPRVTRRLVDSERKMITSGSVFVFDEDESHIKRWTDGFFWSPSRILGNFLLYRETEKRWAGRSANRIEDQDSNGYNTPAHSLSRPKSDAAGLAVDRHRERTLMGSLTDNYKFKPDGLMKKTFSVTIGGVAQHLISYYKVEDVENGRLRSPSSLPELAALDISPEYLDKTHFRNPPKVEIGSDGIPRYRGEADDLDGSPNMISPQLPVPLLTDPSAPPASASTQKRLKRTAGFEDSPAVAKRARRNTGGSSQLDSGSNGTTPTADPGSPNERGASSTPQPAALVSNTTPTIAPTTTTTTEQPPHPVMTVAPMPAYGPPYTGIPTFYAYPPHTHGAAPPPPGIYASSQSMSMYAPPAAGSQTHAVHYAPYGSYPHPMAPQHMQAQTQQHGPQQQAQQQQQQQSLPAPSQAHRNDPSQLTTAGIPPGPPAPVAGPVLYAGLPQQQVPPPQPYYGYYAHSGGAAPGAGISPMGVSMNPMVGMGSVPYAPYQWPVYSGYPPPPAQAHPQVQTHPPTTATVQQVIQQKRESPPT